MSNWTSALISLPAVCVGAALTMAGQALSDHRTRKKEIQLRKEDFRITNFEIQRDALLKLQDILSEFSRKVITERLRRKQEEYPFYDKRPLTMLHSSMKENEEYLSLLNSKIAQIQGKVSGEDNAWFSEIAEEMAEHAEDFLRTSKDTLEEAARILDKRDAFNADFIDFMSQLRLQLYRCGSNDAIRLGEEYIAVVNSWNSHLVTKGLDEHVNKLNMTLYELNRAISNALLHGPFRSGKRRKN